MNIGNNIKWGTVRIPNNRIPGTDNESPTVVEGTLDLIYARDEGTGLGVTNTHVVTPITGPVIILSTYLLCFQPVITLPTLNTIIHQPCWHCF